MPLSCTNERVICFSNGSECALSLSSMPTPSARPVTLATLECLDTDGLCVRVLSSDRVNESLPLLITKDGRCIFNGVDVVEDTDPDVSSCSVRVHGILKADGFIGTARTLVTLETDTQNGKLVATWSDDSVTDIPIINRGLDALIRNMQATIATLESRVATLESL
jgi:hypothetical protein